MCINDSILTTLKESYSLSECAEKYFGCKDGEYVKRIYEYLNECGIDYHDYIKEKETEHYYCLYCGKEITCRARRIRKYCSRECLISSMIKIKADKRNIKNTKKKNNIDLKGKEEIEYKIFGEYKVYKDGTVVHLSNGNVITKRVGHRGYYLICLKVNGVYKTIQFHRLIATLFVENPKGLPFVNHIDGNKLNCSIDNLEWVTPKGNVAHAHENGLMHPARGINTNNGRFTEEEVRAIRKLREEGFTHQKIADMYNVTKGTITQILTGLTYKWVK